MFLAVLVACGGFADRMELMGFMEEPEKRSPSLLWEGGGPGI